MGCKDKNPNYQEIIKGVSQELPDLYTEKKLVNGMC